MAQRWGSVDLSGRLVLNRDLNRASAHEIDMSSRTNFAIASISPWPCVCRGTHAAFQKHRPITVHFVVEF
jgi:hypothetical protein